MPEPVAEPALNGLRLNLRIVSVVIFNFASYLTIGLPLAVLFRRMGNGITIIAS